MRIYDRQAFLQLPPGTLFCKGKPWVFETLQVKEVSLPNDFFCRELQWIEASSSDVAFNRLEAMRATGASFPLETGIGRDGCYDDEDMFLVYEPEDLRELQACLVRAFAVAEACVESSA